MIDKVYRQVMGRAKRQQSPLTRRIFKATATFDSCEMNVYRIEGLDSYAVIMADAAFEVTATLLNEKSTLYARGDTPVVFRKEAMLNTRLVICRSNTSGVLNLFQRNNGEPCIRYFKDKDMVVTCTNIDEEVVQEAALYCHSQSKAVPEYDAVLEAFRYALAKETAE